MGGSCPGVGSLRSEATWPGTAERHTASSPILSARSLLSVSLSLPPSFPSLCLFVFPFPLTGSLCRSPTSPRVPVLLSRRRRPRPCAWLCYPSLLLSTPHLVRSSLSLQHLAHDATQRESPLRIVRWLGLRVAVVAVVVVASCRAVRYTYTRVRVYATREKEREKEEFTVPRFESRPVATVSRNARVSAARGVNLGSCAPAHRRTRGTAVAGSPVRVSVWCVCSFRGCQWHYSSPVGT